MSRWLLRLQTDVVELKTCISTEFWANRILETKNREEGEDAMDIAGGDRGERREERGERREERGERISFDYMRNTTTRDVE